MQSLMPARRVREAQRGPTVYPPSGSLDDVEAEPPAWLQSGLRRQGHGNARIGEEPQEFGLQVEYRQDQAAQRAPELLVAENSTGLGPELNKDGLTRHKLLERYTLDHDVSSTLENGGHPGTSRATGSRVRAPLSRGILKECSHPVRFSLSDRQKQTSQH
jgi:hypothetical protein